jgi:hypothetical protein
MKEKSQIDEMRAALRGDLERGRKRMRASPIVQPQAEPEPEPEPEPPAEEAPRPGIFGSLFGRKS